MEFKSAILKSKHKTAWAMGIAYFTVQITMALFYALVFLKK
jgi:hypothetical protein